MPHPTAHPTPEPTRPTSGPLRHLTQLDLARRWRISPRTLERWRSLRQGPAYLKLGGVVAYRLEDVEAFEAEQRHEAASTSRRAAHGGA
nr:helix-turn-helix domain-containing protein [Belnapia mucosa]